MRISQSARGAMLALALLLAPHGAGALRPAEADPAWARLSIARAPKLVWQAETERHEDSDRKIANKEPQRSFSPVGLVLPGDGRALVAFTGVEADGRRVNMFRVVGADGRLAGTVPIQLADELRAVRQPPGAAIFAFSGTQERFAIAAIGTDGAPLRRVVVPTRYHLEALEAHGDGYLATIRRERLMVMPGQVHATPYNLLRLDAGGRTTWSFEHPRRNHHHVNIGAAARRDRHTLVVLNSGNRQAGGKVPLVAFLLDRSGKIVRRQTLELRSAGTPVPSTLAALPGGGFLLTGTYDGADGNFAAWLDDEGRQQRHAPIAAKDMHIQQWPWPVADGGFLAASDKGGLLRFDGQGALRWHLPRESWVTNDIRPVEGGLVVLGSSREVSDRPAGADQPADRITTWRHVLALYRFE